MEQSKWPMKIAEPTVEDNNKKLSKAGISGHIMIWTAFSNEIWNEQPERVDQIVCDPQSVPSLSFVRFDRTETRRYGEELDEDEIKEFRIFAKRVLKTDGYCVLLIPFYMLGPWYTSFANAWFHVIKYPYLVIYSPESARKPSGPVLLQNATEYAVIAKAPGDFQRYLKPDFKAMFHILECTSTRDGSLVGNVAYVKHKLTYPDTKIPLRNTEKRLTESIDLFTTQPGCTMDPYECTLTTPISALRT